MKTESLSPQDLKRTVRERLAAARQSPELAAAAGEVSKLEQAEAKALAELQQPPSEEDPFKHDSARQRLATVREELTAAKSRLRSLSEAADRRGAAAIQDLHRPIWGAVQKGVHDLIAAELAAAALQTAAGAAGSGLFFGGLHELTAVRVRLEAIAQRWAEFEGGQR